MFELKEDPQGFVRMTISGKVEAGEMQAGLEAYLACLKDDRKTDFLYTITDFHLPTLEAWGIETRYIPMLFSSLSKVGKVAVLADASWLKIAAEIEGKLIPGLEIEAFDLGEDEAAVAWLLKGD